MRYFTECNLTLALSWQAIVNCYDINACGRLHVRCQTCDKAYTSMFFDGCVCRLAVAHLGKKPAAGSQLNCIMFCLLWHAAMRLPAEVGAALLLLA